MRYFLALLIVLLICTSAAFAYLAFAFYEPQGLRRGSLKARIFIPESFRNLPTPETCVPPVYSKSLQECGGICGAQYSLNFGTISSNDDLNNALQDTYIALGIPKDALTISVTETSEGSRCRDVSVTAYFDYDGDDS